VITPVGYDGGFRYLRLSAGFKIPASLFTKLPYPRATAVFVPLLELVAAPDATFPDRPGRAHGIQGFLQVRLFAERA
jgi:hypothetical protein